VWLYLLSPSMGKCFAVSGYQGRSNTVRHRLHLGLDPGLLPQGPAARLPADFSMSRNFQFEGVGGSGFSFLPCVLQIPPSMCAYAPKELQAALTEADAPGTGTSTPTPKRSRKSPDAQDGGAEDQVRHLTAYDCADIVRNHHEASREQMTERTHVCPLLRVHMCIPDHTRHQHTHASVHRQAFLACIRRCARADRRGTFADAREHRLQQYLQ
jgi:hypothetical protein